MNYWTFDAETFYDPATKYSLTNMTAEEYIRDERFDLIGFAIGIKGQPQTWYTGTLEYLRDIAQSFDWSQMFVIGHNLSLFDALVLTEVLGVRPAYYGCTLQLARRLHGSKGPDGKNLSNALGALARMYNLPIDKGDEVIRAAGKRRLDFNPHELAAYGNYCVKDSIICGMLWDAMVTKFPKTELFIAHLATKMWAEARLALDVPLLRAMGIELAERKAATLSEVANILGVDPSAEHGVRMDMTQKLLRSNVKFADMLRYYGVAIPMKRSPKRRDAEGRALLVEAFAKTDEGMVALTEYEEADEDTNLIVQALATARLGTKSTIAESRVQRFLDIGQRGLLPVPYMYGKSHCDRYAGTQGINMQNLTRTKSITPRTPNGSLIITPVGFSYLFKRKYGRDKANRKIVVAVMDRELNVWCTDPSNKEVGVQAHVAGLRDAVIAPPGFRIVVADSANIELRTCHHLCGQEDSISVLRAGGDLYCDFATSFYGRPITKADEAERQHGKTAELQLQFQSGAESFRRAARIMSGMRLTELEAQQTVDVYRGKRRSIVQSWYNAQRAIPKMAAGGGFYLDQWGFCFVEHNAIRFPNGMRMEYHNLRQEEMLNYDGLVETNWVYDDKEDRKIRKVYGGKVIQNVTQKLARDVVFEQKCRIERRIGTYERQGEGIVMSTHDEPVALVREDRADETLAIMIEEMSQAPTWWPSLPVKAEGDIGVRYSDAK